MTCFLILGNQLFDPTLIRKLVGPAGSDRSLVFFMREDLELCTHFKYHKHKILFFLSAMRKYAAELRSHGFRVEYQKLGDGAETFDQALRQFMKDNQVSRLETFEIEDKFFETRIQSLASARTIELHIHESPMFLTSRDAFRVYLKKHKRPFMKNFYEEQRKRLRILVQSDGTPVGDQWSFDDDNRQPLPKDYQPEVLPIYELDRTDKDVASLVEKTFASHPGRCADFWLPTDRKGAEKWLDCFLTERFRDFGPYEDALSREHPFVNHSVLTPFLNTGLLTPDQVVKRALQAARKNSVPLNSCEGFIRQIIGWREFVRGIYQNFSDRQDTQNFWQHQRRLNDLWYTGKTGIAPLDDVIRKTLRYGYAHHIERLMIVGSLMLLLEIDPREAHRWFMEMFIDSSDWVMGPNVYGMALFSDGGIFATKPYICGSNYYRKMGGYKSGDWQDGVDGLYWSFIHRHRPFFAKNPRLSMMVKSLEKMPAEKKVRLFKAADELKLRLTTASQ